MKAGAHIRFVEQFCRQSKGRWAGRPLELMDWQRHLLMRAFGWKHADGTRRFRTVHVEVPKKQGKSTLTSALALDLAIADGEPAAEVYLNAVDRQQADIVFEECCRMVEASPDLSRRLKTSRHHGTIVDPRTYSKIAKNSADVPSKDGVSASGTIFDEVHRFKNRDMWDVFRFAGASRTQPVTIAITTAGQEGDGLWWELRKHSEDVENGVIADIGHLGLVCRAAETDDLDDPAVWHRANPALGTTMSLEDFRRDYELAKVKGGADWANFLRLRLGIVMRSEGQWIALSNWDACAEPWGQPDRYTPMYVGLDLSSKDDLTAMVALAGDFESGFTVHSRFWLPEDNIASLEARHGAPYRSWCQEGLIDLTPGAVIDQAFIENEIVGIAGHYNVKKVYSDPYNAERLAVDLREKHGLPVEFLAQGWRNLSDATKTVQELVLGPAPARGTQGPPMERRQRGGEDGCQRESPAGQGEEPDEDRRRLRAGQRGQGRDRQRPRAERV